MKFLKKLLDKLFPYDPKAAAERQAEQPDYDWSMGQLEALTGIPVINRPMEEKKK